MDNLIKEADDLQAQKTITNNQYLALKNKQIIQMML